MADMQLSHTYTIDKWKSIQMHLPMFATFILACVIRNSAPDHQVQHDCLIDTTSTTVHLITK